MSILIVKLSFQKVAKLKLLKAFSKQNFAKLNLTIKSYDKKILSNYEHYKYTKLFNTLTIRFYNNYFVTAIKLFLYKR